jgi:hypothetical protein
VAEAAGQYQRHRENEARHLAVMASHDLGADWSAEVHAAVVEARRHIRAAYEARVAFRDQVQQFVRANRSERVPLAAVLRQTRAMLHLLMSANAIRDDGGWLEAEVLEWAIAAYQE